MINHQNKIVFIHIPKTGGTSIDVFFNGSMQGHSCLKDYEYYLPKKQFDQYFKFATVRNPFDLLVSSYTMVIKRIQQKHLHTLKQFGHNVFSFEEYLKNKIQNYTVGTEPFISTNFSHSMFNSNQIYWIKDSQGKINIDYVMKFENLQEDFNVVCDKIGIPQQQLPHKNKSNHKHYTEFYDDETREIVAQKYAKDIEYFGYKFGD